MKIKDKLNGVNLEIHSSLRFEKILMFKLALEWKNKKKI